MLQRNELLKLRGSTRSEIHCDAVKSKASAIAGTAVASAHRHETVSETAATKTTQKTRNCCCAEANPTDGAEKQPLRGQL